MSIGTSTLTPYIYRFVLSRSPHKKYDIRQRLAITSTWPCSWPLLFSIARAIFACCHPSVPLSSISFPTTLHRSLVTLHLSIQWKHLPFSTGHFLPAGCTKWTRIDQSGKHWTLRMLSTTGTLLGLSSMFRITLMLNRPSYQRRLVSDPEFMPYRLQRLSIGSSKSSVAWNVTESNAVSRRSSASSYASAGSNTSTNSNYSTAQGTNTTSLPSRPSSLTNIQRLRSTNPPPPLFKRLPPAIYECIMQHLSTLHLSVSSTSCATCYMRDLCSLALTSRAWDRAVRTRL